jgi:hypothetical protein
MAPFVEIKKKKIRSNFFGWGTAEKQTGFTLTSCKSS